MKLRPATPAHLASMLGWFPDARSCAIWAGPQFRFPFTLDSFIQDSLLATLDSYVLLDDAGAVAAFGQFYLRAGRCHFGWLAVAPEQRGHRVGERLLRALATQGHAQLGLAECSLFVVRDNVPAIRLYQRLGFCSRPYPAELPDSSHDFQVVATPRLLGS